MPEYLVKDVTSNTSGITRPMFVQEITKIGEGAFGTVLQANLKNALSEPNSPQDVWIGPFAIKKVPAQTEYKSRELQILKQTNHPSISIITLIRMTITEFINIWQWNVYPATCNLRLSVII